MDKDKVAARRSRSAPRVISPRNKVTVALPLSMIRTGEPAAMRAGDWIGVAGVVVAAIGFSVAIRQLARVAHALEAGQASRRADQQATGSPAGASWPPAEEVPQDRAGVSEHDGLPEKGLVRGAS